MSTALSTFLYLNRTEHILIFPWILTASFSLTENVTVIDLDTESDYFTIMYCR